MKNIYYPLILSLVLIVGVFIGIRFSPNQSFISRNSRFNKLNDIISYIEANYVDSLEKSDLIDDAIQKILENLDPHSYYINSKDLAALNEPLEGEFEGIGVEFNIQEDTIVVVTPLTGGPSEKLGISPGDRIIKVNDSLIAGVGVQNNDVLKMLKGPSGTEVKVSIARNGFKKLIDYTITRDKIPITSIEAAYTLQDSIAYIKISRFSKTTHQEFIESMNGFKNPKGLILDLRNNGGGYLETAILLIDEFLKRNQLIVYTQGNARPRSEHFARNGQPYENMPLCVLIDEGSASASEIVAGAIQDNDRGFVIGRRSFGKGLVQEQAPWPDGSALRLTIARYYTPSGRCIQRPYDKGQKAYYQDFYDHIGGPDSTNTSITNDSTVYKTKMGRPVYGGGGILPDIVVSHDTFTDPLFFTEIFYTGALRKFSFDYADNNRQKLEYPSVNAFINGFSLTPNEIQSFITYCQKNHNIEASKRYNQEFIAEVKRYLEANIARYIHHNNAYYPILYKTDNTINTALKSLNQSLIQQ